VLEAPRLAIERVVVLGLPGPLDGYRVTLEAPDGPPGAAPAAAGGGQPDAGERRQLRAVLGGLRFGPAAAGQGRALVVRAAGLALGRDWELAFSGGVTVGGEESGHAAEMR
jgi:hypothetical protein